MMRLLLFLLCLSLNAFAQKSVPFRIDSLPTEGVLLDNNWTFHAGDNLEWAKPDFDDTAWESIDPTKDIMDLPQIQNGKIGWMRLRMTIDSSLMPQPFILQIHQTLASEIYVDGRLIEKHGTLDSSKIKADFIVFHSMGLPKSKTNVVIAVRFAYQKSIPYIKYMGRPNYCFYARVVPMKNIEDLISHGNKLIMFAFAKIGAFLILFLLHLAFFIFYPFQKTNLYFSGMALCYAVFTLIWGLTVVLFPTNAELLMYLGLIRVPLYSLTYMLLLAALYSIFNFKKDVVFWLMFGFSIVLNIVFFSNYKRGLPLSEAGTNILSTLASVYIVLKARISKKKKFTTYSYWTHFLNSWYRV